MSEDPTGDKAATAVATPEPTEEETFRAEQLAAAQAQGLTSPNAVPEKRPQASQQGDNGPNALTQKLMDAGEISDEPMGKDAYDRAESESQAKKAAKASKVEGFGPGSWVRVTNEDSPHFGRIFAVTRVVEYRSIEDQLTVTSGSPDQLYVLPQVVQARARGDERDGESVVLDVDEQGLVKDSNFRGTAHRV